MSAITDPVELETAAKSGGISMKEVCLEAGVAQSTYCRWKNGSTSPRLEVVQRLSVALTGLLARPNQEAGV
ncbi:helix-turn-helix transcriptional regulator [Acetobacter sacchari]|uniref:Helix-turn-helix transcriptional regulator n=1 Tax=Acetobacter sacchari TaxID=2661687 RepID=A0ABS3M1R5_9PROT|nr:helix-turn-helix transcriptional regulator [Acetobacter sacchari]MBO1362088.1 helix-turn-helix transcriptional regulator [Acetobacter sacchari]